MSKDQCKLDIALAIEEFEEEAVDKNLRLLIMDYYQYFRNEIQHAKKVKDTTKMKIAVHTLKSTSRYLCCEYFALKCQDIEDMVKKTWEQIDKVYEEFMQCYDWFYEDAREQYEIFKSKNGKNDAKDEIPSPEPIKHQNKSSDDIGHFENKSSNSSIPSMKILKRNPTIKEENEEECEPISFRRSEESKTPTFDKNGINL
jgi:hypothetical protein